MQPNDSSPPTVEALSAHIEELMGQIEALRQTALLDPLVQTLVDVRMRAVMIDILNAPNDAGVSVCSWCGLVSEINDADARINHAMTCPSSPAAARIRQLERTQQLPFVTALSVDLRARPDVIRDLLLASVIDPILALEFLDQHPFVQNISITKSSPDKTEFPDVWEAVIYAESMAHNSFENEEEDVLYASYAGVGISAELALAQAIENWALDIPAMGFEEEEDQDSDDSMEGEE